MIKFKKILALALVGVLSVSSLVGCGKKSGSKGGGSETDIEISYWLSGLGREWLDNMVAAFEEKYPEYKVTIKSSSDVGGVKAPFGKEDVDSVDLYMANAEYNYEYSEPLNDLLDSKAEGESKTLREKINPSYLELETASDGNVYELTYGGGAIGFVYNKRLFEEAGVRNLPRTTNELISACDTLYASGIAPICHFKTTVSYYNFISDTWRMQYDGKDYFIKNFYGCTDANGTSPSKDVFTAKDGRYEVLKVMEKLLTPDYVLTGSNTHEMTTMQTKFLQGECAMMVTGGWIGNEMSMSDKMGDFAFMKSPVISSITDKLATVTEESELRAVIAAVDKVTDGEEELSAYQDGENYKVDELSVSAADWEYIYKARNTVPTNYSGETMFIPTYANAKEGAKEFIRFMYSDEGYKIYTDTLHLPLPLTLDSGELDTSDWNEFEKDQLNLINSTVQTASSYIKGQHPIFYLGGADAYGNEVIFDKFCAKNKSDRVNAKSAWDKIVARVEQLYDNTWLANMGE